MANGMESNMANFRLWQNDQILTAFENDDYANLDTLCNQALQNPALPRYYRAQYEMFLAFVPGRNARAHLDSSLRSIDDMERLLEVEGRERAEVTSLKERVLELKESVVEETVQISANQEPLETVTDDPEAEVEEEDKPTTAMAEQPQSDTGTQQPTSELSEMPLPPAVISSPQPRPAGTPATSPMRYGRRTFKEMDSEADTTGEMGDDSEEPAAEEERPGSPEKRRKHSHGDD